jgi:hypothetical protein
MSLSERLEDLRHARAIIRRLPRVPQKLLVERSFDRISARFERLKPITQVDYDALVEKLRYAAKSRSISGLSLREMRLAASCLFDGEQRRLADDDVLLDQYLDALRSIGSRIAIKRLIHCYCVHFNPRHRGIQRIGAFLREAISSIEGRWEWRERQRSQMLFDPAQAPQRLTLLTIDSKNPREELEKVGLTGQLLVSGLSSCVFLNALKIIQKRLEADANPEEVDRAVAWVQNERGGMYFSAHRGALANALLLPWTKKDPDHACRQKLQSYLLDNWSDPRIDGGSWIGTDEAARDVLIRWLAQATLEQFLKVVDRVAAKHQWDYRRAFWNAYIEKRVVGNAWVAFGSEGTHVATGLAEETGDALMRRFATLGGAGANQAVLLLRIGDLVVADWSHNGRLRIWRRGNPKAPEFNMKSYVAMDLRADCDFDTVHLPPDGWQGKAEAYIRRNTGIRLIEAEYMPRRRPN